MSTELSFSIIMVCLVFSAFFSAAETAITSLGNLKVKHLIESKGRSYSVFKLWLDFPGRVLTTILIFNNVVNILASSVATQLATHYFSSGAIGIATGTTTLLVLIFGEIVPKSFAKAFSEKIALVAMRIIYILYFACLPIVRALSWFADSLIRFVSKGKVNDIHITEEEIEFMVSEGERAGVIQGVKKDIIEGAFDFDETMVKEIMTPRTDITSFRHDATLADISELIIRTGHSRLPVYQDNIDHIVGIVLAKDLLSLRFGKSAEDKASMTAKDVMREAIFAPESRSIMDVFKDLKKSKSHMCVIIDEYGGTAGLVTMEDILEEFVGEIQDEFDAEEAKILQISPSLYEVSGTLNLQDFYEHFDLKEEQFTEDQKGKDVDTLAGWITQLLGEIPKIGQSVEINDISMEVIEVKRRRLRLVKVEKKQVKGKTST